MHLYFLEAKNKYILDDLVQFSVIIWVVNEDLYLIDLFVNNDYKV